ncbi:phosphoenolpyruvate-dependent sugar phosphotransferase system EIIA component [Tepidibacillus fermentans]|uniref:Phosphoenolpyruvate-dependent sugar phosphotransferase system EIIA component n=1 Tax=Tepidibacillus fermentans TaxID=1281767 RepID=A0A4R3KGJ7_9BACI|nr:phosphoenolpyruvate-dependent sugar phosphotransferase system EIIA component [Tepidibacillus fermentans]
MVGSSLHIGLETVQMEGEGFTAHVKEGDKVKAGDALISFDLNLIKEKAKSTITPLVITNGEKVGQMERLAQENVSKGQTQVLKIHLA